jgi:hypothetical protein
MPDVEVFTGQLMLAMVDRNYTQLQQLMGDPFTIGYWQSEGASLPPGVAIVQLRNNYLTPVATPAFDTTSDLTALLNGTDPLTMWGPAVNALKAVRVTGLGVERADEAILIVAQRADRTLYWHGLLIATGGFGSAAEPVEPVATATAPAATATLPAPTATADTAARPTAVRYVLVLQNVNLRGGPGRQYPVLSSARHGAVVEVFGVSADAGWWNVRCPDNTVGNCWLSAEPSLTRPTAGPQPATPTRVPTPPPPSGQPVRIQFAPGAVSATVNGTVTFPQQPQYLLRALAGQEMTVELLSFEGQANFAITGVSDGQPYKRLVNEERFFRFTLPSTQDYLITVAVPAGSVNYSLVATVITPGVPPPSNEPIRLQFAPGAISATVDGYLIAETQQEYIVRALAGQTMTVELFSPTGNADLYIIGADGVLYKRYGVGEPTFAFVLPATQDYYLGVSAYGGDANYTMTVTIE